MSDAARKAERAIVAELMDGLEVARRHYNIPADTLASKAEISPRMLRYLKAGRSTSLRRLLQLADACGCELSIRLRARRGGNSNEVKYFETDGR